MNNIDFTEKGGMPLDQGTLEFMQNAYSSTIKAMAGNLGKYVILSGDKIKGGWVSIDGEVMPFAKSEGNTSDSCFVVTNETTAVFKDGLSKPVYKSKQLVFGKGDPQLDWSSFFPLIKLVDIIKKVNIINSVPLGCPVTFAGYPAKIPTGWTLCDGKQVERTKYPLLFDILGDTHGTISPTHFYLPDLRKRFVVGYDNIIDTLNPNSDEIPPVAGDKEVNYGKIGNRGGKNEHTLLPAEQGKIKITTKNGDYGDGTGTAIHKISLNDTLVNGEGDGLVCSQELNLLKTAGSHENRPPYLVLAYIMQLK